MIDMLVEAMTMIRMAWRLGTDVDFEQYRASSWTVAPLTVTMGN
jgi:hypothetical protein